MHPPHLPAARRLRARAILGFAVFGVWWGVWGALLPAIQRHAQLDDGRFGIALLFIAVGAMVSMRGAGGLVDRLGGLVLPIALVGFGVAGVMPTLVTGVVALSATMFAVGAFSGAIDVAINGVAARYEYVTDEPVMNLAHGSFSAGVLVASPIAGAVRDIGWSPTSVFAVAAVVLATAAVIVSDRSPGTATVGSEPPTGAPWRWWRPPPHLLLLGVLVGLAYLVESAWQNWSAILLERTLLARPAVAALGPAVFALTAAVGRFAGQALLRRVPETRLLATASLVAAGGTVLAATAPTVAMALIGIGLAGAGTSICAPTLLARAARAVPEHRHGAAIGTVTTLGYLGFGVAPALVGLVSRALSLRWALGSVAAAAVLIAVASRRPSPVDDQRKGT